MRVYMRKYVSEKVIQMENGVEGEKERGEKKEIGRETTV